MRALVVCDSEFGTTERLARTIAVALGEGEPAAVVAARTASAGDVAASDLVAVGGPTQAHGLSPALRAVLDHLPPEAVRDLAMVAFDTRLSWPRILSGSAAAISAQLEKKGARLVAPPESFLVRGKDGPLADGEVERAASCARTLCAAGGRSTQERPHHTRRSNPV
jgi:flavodoxin